MSVFAMVVWIVAISLIAGVLHDYLKTRRIEASKHSSVNLDEINALKERITVLEKIVTDERYDLRRELNQLERHG
ncbi:MAG: hypothetical protein ACR2PZ_05110 [Pseudomonadales bacterium]